MDQSTKAIGAIDHATGFKVGDGRATAEAYFRLLIECSADAMFVIGQGGAIFFAGGGGLAEFGYQPADMIGRATREFLHPDDIAEQRQVVSQIRVENGMVSRSEARVKHRDGRWIPCEVISRGAIDPEGQPVLITTLRNITERRDAANKTRESAATLRKIIDASPDIISINRFSDGSYLDTSTSFVDSGFDRTEVVGKSSGKLGIWSDRNQFKDYLRFLNERGLVQNLEADFKLKDGTISPCLISATIAELNGEKCVISFTRDISRIRRTENELRAARTAALAASQAKSEFLSSMSHEIRTPMNAILGMAELLDETELNLDQKKYVETMRSNGNALLGLINDILDLARVESGRLTLESTDFDLEDLTGGVAEMLAVRAHAKGIEILSRVKPEVPLRVCGDPLRLRQILINLLGNAIKFTDSGHVLVTVEVDDSSKDRLALHFSVSDTGIGIAADKLDAIFSNFTQADSSTSRQFGGSGLGLAIAKRLVELMGGKIWVESEPGRGSVFHFSAQFAKATSTAEDATSIAPLSLRDARVLVVDDHKTNRLILDEMMTKAGAQVVEAASGAEALRLLEEARRTGHQFSLMLLDCRMPQMDGLEVARRLRAGPEHDLTIVMLTSDDLKLNVARFEEYGLDGYLTKPVRRVELFAAITNARARREGRTPFTSASHSRAVSDSGKKIEGMNLRILLADDSADNRLLVRSFCRKLPIQFDDAENGKIAVDKWSRGKYDLIIMDIQMPEMDGLTAIRTIRDCERKAGHMRTPIAALSAAAREEDVKRSADAGADIHLNKPVMKKTLVDAITKLTEGAKPCHPAAATASS
jgi:two-component system sensor histidine kinase/response regulator